MKGKIFIQILLYICLIKMHGSSQENTHSKKFIPYFRRQVEEMEDNNLPETTEKDDPRSNLVSFLVNNVKEIFDDIVETTEARSQETTINSTMIIIATTPCPTNSSITFSSNITISSTEVSIISSTPTQLTRVNSTSPNLTSMSSIRTTSVLTTSTAITYKNLTLNTLLDEKHTRQSELTKKKGVSKTDKMERDVQTQSQVSSASPNTGNTSESYLEHDPRRSCIMCNNVAIEDCNDPKNKLIQSVMCDRDDDLCYSMHTPFGIVDRGCYNANHNLTTYVCSCNLCNYISISEMPLTFNNKQDWIDNVIEISRTRHFRKSIFKDMSCLRCEVNTTVQKADLLESANCLEGSIGNIPVEECEENEVCAVKAHRADGYIWRGCVRAPLYNYWWQFCDYDLCNYDTVLSLYDFI